LRSRGIDKTAKEKVREKGENGEGRRIGKRRRRRKWTNDREFKLEGHLDLLIR